MISILLMNLSIYTQKPQYDGAGRPEAYRQQSAMEKQDSMAGLSWQFLGPANISNLNGAIDPEIHPRETWSLSLPTEDIFLSWTPIRSMEVKNNQHSGIGKHGME